jgi:CelD/BcsL family acetyltransferase involved in cellulose biosynthesis
VDTVVPLNVTDETRADPLTAHVITSREELEAFSPQWRSFVDGPVNGCVLFNDPDYILARLAIEPSNIPFVVAVRRGPQLRAVAPFYVAQGQLALRFSVCKVLGWAVRFARLFGDGLQVTSGEDERECILEAFRALLAHRELFDLVAFDSLPTHGPLWDATADPRAGAGNWRRYPASAQLEIRHQIVFPATYEEYLASLGSRTRQNLRRMTRKLCQDRRGRLERITTPEQVPAFLEAVDRIFRETWQAATFGYWQRNRPDQVQFFQTIAQRGWLRSYLLYDGDNPLAFDIAFQYRGVFYAYEIGFAQRAAEASPGTVLMHLFIEDLFREQTPRLLDFGGGDAAYKRSFCNASQETAAVWLIPQGSWRWVGRAQQCLFALERGCRRTLVALKMDRVVRRLLKRQR